MNKTALEIDKEGIVKVKNFLNPTQVFDLKKIIIPLGVPKGNKNSFVATTPYKFFLKILKLNFKKIRHDFKISRLKKNVMQEIASEYFKRKAILKAADVYCSPVSNNPILPWHTDQSYSGRVDIKEDNYVHPDKFNLKFMIYLTDVGPQNGCTSYVPKSHKITYLVRKGIYEKKLIYQPYWSLNQLIDFIKKKENYKYIKERLEDQNLIDDLLNTCSHQKKIDQTNAKLKHSNFEFKDEMEKKYDFSLNAGDSIIFNEGGIHRGSKNLLSNRIVIRFMYSI